LADKGSGPLLSRAPTESDLVRIARSLNAEGVSYAVIGGFAMIHYGYVRATMDIDLLVRPEPENIERIRRALSILEDKAVLDVRPDDVKQYNVVRVADEVVIDLLAQACEVTLTDVAAEIEMEVVHGVAIPFLSPKALLMTKQTPRDKDALDRLFLQELLANDP